MLPFSKKKFQLNLYMNKGFILLMVKKKWVVKLRKDQAEFFEDTEEIPKYFAKDAMIKPVFLLKNDETEIILKKLRKENINECVVIDENGKFFGEINVEDVIKLLLHQVKFEPLVQVLNVGYRREFLYLKAKNLVNKHKNTVTLETPINKVIQLVYKEGFNYLPVVDKDKKVLGVITPSSVINFLRDK